METALHLAKTRKKGKTNVRELGFIRVNTFVSNKSNQRVCKLNQQSLNQFYSGIIRIKEDNLKKSKVLIPNYFTQPSILCHLLLYNFKTRTVKSNQKYLKTWLISIIYISINIISLSELRVNNNLLRSNNQQQYVYGFVYYKNLIFKYTVFIANKNHKFQQKQFQLYQFTIILCLHLNNQFLCNQKSCTVKFRKDCRLFLIITFKICKDFLIDNQFCTEKQRLKIKVTKIYNQINYLSNCYQVVIQIGKINQIKNVFINKQINFKKQILQCILCFTKINKTRFIFNQKQQVQQFFNKCINEKIKY
ncbi:transmembrane protein, putative (macronuclear) [Tetrahymena thermophila SB210]|uniref:Transmembrane protein, putative n=1 Tax=Tetrahymena thermophila (strain SB210) TaxID=312017 RepID=W7XIA6_TETTS|nr:transmembrane protein, putative [Tetrahymena thermophila SB210]EWS74466.1 transmembrane protein, putative [Tetrahymena thermophila SB210]|eukprot:XP_012653043.1 transmembrane protein, putative [Tetrahymena thermophila SB210]